MSFIAPQNPTALAACQTHVKNNLTKRSFLGTQQVYIRDPSFFKDFSTKENIQAVIQNDLSLVINGAIKKSEITTLIHSKGRRMFVICVHGGVRMDCLRLMLQKGLTDKTLPLQEIHFRHRIYGADFRRFIDSQLIIDSTPAWSALAPGSFLKNIVTKHDPLPMQSEESCGNGAAASVWACRFDTMHQSDFRTGDTGIADRTLSNRLAVKEFSDHVQADREKSFVNFLQTNRIQHGHIVKFYFGFEFGGKYHLASQLADMNLQNLWPKTKLHEYDPRWLRLQIIGLVEALKTIHGPINGTTAYHHDIKPENILVFGKEDQFKLKLGDFGAAGFGGKFTPDVGSHQTHAKGDDYLPPEHIYGRPTSRPHDVWSLGCVLVELCVWYFNGWDPNGLYQFKEDIKNTKDNDRQCWFIGPPLRDAPQSGVAAASGSDAGRPSVLAGPVLKKLDALRSRNTNMKSVVDVLSKMLEISPSSRITAAAAFAEFKAIPIDWQA